MGWREWAKPKKQATFADSITDMWKQAAYDHAIANPNGHWARWYDYLDTVKLIEPPKKKRLKRKHVK